MKKKIPVFKTEEEEALYWSEHSPLEYPEEVKNAEETFHFALSLLKKAAKEHKEKKRLLTFRMEPSQIMLAKIIAKRHGDNYQSLLRKWVRDGISKELKDDPNIAKEVRRDGLHLV